MTPGPGRGDPAAVGYGAQGLQAPCRRGGRLLAVVRLRTARWPAVRPAPREPARPAFLAGAGPAAIGAIIGAAIPLAGALRVTWQFAVLAAAAAALLVARRSVVVTLACAGAVGVVVALAGGPFRAKRYA